MSSVVLDQSSAEKLRECRQITVLRDPSGNIVGYFEPPQLHIYAKGEVPEFVEEALKKPLEDSDKLTTEEVLRRLRSRP